MFHFQTLQFKKQVQQPQKSTQKGEKEENVYYLKSNKNANVHLQNKHWTILINTVKN